MCIYAVTREGHQGRTPLIGGITYNDNSTKIEDPKYLPENRKRWGGRGGDNNHNLLASMHVLMHNILWWEIESDGGNNFIGVGGTPHFLVSNQFYPTSKALELKGGDNIPALKANILLSPSTC